MGICVCVACVCICQKAKSPSENSITWSQAWHALFTPFHSNTSTLLALECNDIYMNMFNRYICDMFCVSFQFKRRQSTQHFAIVDGRCCCRSSYGHSDVFRDADMHTGRVRVESVCAWEREIHLYMLKLTYVYFVHIMSFGYVEFLSKHQKMLALTHTRVILTPIQTDRLT